MPRASRFLRDGYTFHLTHRCHDRRYLLKFARDRDVYRKWLREAVNRYEVAVYGYCITSNHVHLIVHVDEKARVGLLMHLVAGAFATQLNNRKGHEGSVWEHPYHCTLIQDGQHLLNCLRYVSLNMVRAGVVQHPSEWRWCGHDELAGTRSRYCILNIERLLESLAMDQVEDFRKVYEEGIKQQLQRSKLIRESVWTDSIAVGDRLFVEKIAKNCTKRSKFQYSEVPKSTLSNAWAVRELGNPYSAVSTHKPASKTL